MSRKIAPGPLRDDIELLRLCARTQCGDANAACIRQLAAGPIDWGAFIRRAQVHAVLPIAASQLLSVAGDAIPPEAALQLKSKLRSYAMSNMSLLRDMLKLLGALDAASIPTITLKGASLAQLAYGNLTLRPFGDVDILVCPADAVKVVRVLESFGYPGWEPERDIVEHLKGEHEETFTHPHGGATVDLHWALSRGYLPYDVPFDTLLQRAQPVQLGGREMLTLGTEDLLLFLCLHGTKHAWERLQWVCDIAELIRSQPAVDLVALLQRATAVGNRRVFLVALELARSILDVPLPASIANALRSDAAVMSLAASLRDRLLAPDLQSVSVSPLRKSLTTVRFHLSMLERKRDRFRYFVQSALPNPRDRSTVPLPGPLRWSYFFVRPVRLIRRYIFGGIYTS